MTFIDQAYAAAPASPSPIAAPSSKPRASFLCRSERERRARLFSIALLCAGWTGGMLARALDVHLSFAGRLKRGDRVVNEEQLLTLSRFDRLRAELVNVGLLGEGAAT